MTIKNRLIEAAKELNIPLEWGGDWKNFKDGPHYQLPWKQYLK
ncbi:M15 family metallopeptidase [Alkanindiges illinoisensis]